VPQAGHLLPQGEKEGLADAANVSDFVQIDIQDRHIEDVRLVAILVVQMNKPDRFITDEHLDGIIQLGARPHVDILVVEFELQEFLQLDDLGMVHDAYPADLG
jgi:hypothetical protein